MQVVTCADDVAATADEKDVTVSVADIVVRSFLSSDFSDETSGTRSYTAVGKFSWVIDAIGLKPKPSLTSCANQLLQRVAKREWNARPRDGTEGAISAFLLVFTRNTRVTGVTRGAQTLNEHALL